MLQAVVTPLSVVQDGVYRIRNGTQQPRYLELHTDNTVRLAPLYLNNDAQKWKITLVTGGAYTVHNQSNANINSMGIDATSIPRAVIGVTPSSNQTWNIDTRGDTFMIGNSKDSTALHAQQAPLAVHVWDRNNDHDAQHWTFEVIGGSTSGAGPMSGGASLSGEASLSGGGNSYSGNNLTLTAPLTLLEIPHYPGLYSFAVANISPGTIIENVNIYLSGYGFQTTPPFYTIVDVYAAPAATTDSGKENFLENTSFPSGWTHLSIPILDTSKAIPLHRVLHRWDTATDRLTEIHSRDLMFTLPNNMQVYLSVHAGDEIQYLGCRATIRTQ